MDKLPLLLLVLLVMTACSKKGILPALPTTGPVKPPPHPPGTYGPQVALIIGQSNALRFGQSTGTQVFEDKSQSFSPGPVTFINAAVGGTFLSEWMPGTAYYQNALSLAAGKQVSVILWDQGEAEAEGGDETLVSSWAMNFTSMMNSLRAALGNPKIPVLYCRLGGDVAGSLPLGNKMYNAQSSVYLPYSELVNLDGIVVDDGLHYTDAGYQEIGQQYANAYRTVLQGD